MKLGANTKIESIYYFLDESGYPYLSYDEEYQEKQFEVDYNGLKCIVGRSNNMDSDNEQLTPNTFSYFIKVGGRVINNSAKDVPKILDYLKKSRYAEGGLTMKAPKLLAPNGNTTFDSNNPDIRYSEGGTPKLNLIKTYLHSYNDTEYLAFGYNHNRVFAIGKNKFSESFMKETIREYYNNVSIIKFGKLFRKYINPDFSAEFNKERIRPNFSWKELSSYIIGDGDYSIEYEQFLSFCKDAKINLPTNSNTTFDSNNPDIRYGLGGSVVSSRLFIPNVRGGWTKDKIIKYFKLKSSDYISTLKLLKYISEFDNWQQFKNHIYYHGTQSYIERALKPSITISEREAERIGGGGYGQRYFGISLTKRKRTAESFSGMSSGVTIYPVILKRDANVIERTDLKDAADIEDIIVELYEKGVDAVWIGGGEEELVVVNPYSVLLYKNGKEYHSVYGGFKSIPLTDEKIKEIYDNSKNIFEKYLEEYNSKQNKEERESFTRSLPNIQFELGGELTLTSEQVEQKLGRELHWWNDDAIEIEGKLYKKVYLRPEYVKK